MVPVVPDRSSAQAPTGHLTVVVDSPYDLVRYGAQALLRDVEWLDLDIGCTPGPRPRADVVLHDLRPDLDGAPSPVARGRSVVALTPVVDGPALERATAIGAASLLSFAATREEMVATIRAAGRGGPVPAPEPTDPPPGGLSERQLEIVALVAAGLSNDEIATHLYLSPNTVKTHLRTAYARLGLSSRTQAMGWYLGQRPRGAWPLPRRPAERSQGPVLGHPVRVEATSA